MSKTYRHKLDHIWQRNLKSQKFKDGCLKTWLRIGRGEGIQDYQLKTT